MLSVPNSFVRKVTRLSRVAFAAGTHRCLGSHLARVELRVAIDQFHRRIPDYRVADGDAIRYDMHGVREASYLPLAFSAR